MNYVRSLVAFVIAVFMLASVSLAQQSPLPGHQWKWIQFPQLPALADGSMTTGMIVNNGSRGFALTFIFVAPSPPAQLAEADKMVVRLHLPNGTILDSRPDPGRGKVQIVNGGSVETNYSYAFPWGKNVLEEAWIEMKVTGRTYWFELPYGFTRDPSDPMTLIEKRSGHPTIAPAMKAMSPDDRIVPWLYVYYDLGKVENHWSLAVEMANPFDANATVILYKEDGHPWSLNSPTTSLNISVPNGRTSRGRCVNLHIHDDGFRRSDTFSIDGFGVVDNRRGWGTAHIVVEDVDHAFTIPSSLFKYVHGTAEPYSKAMLKRSYPYLNGITAANTVF